MFSSYNTSIEGMEQKLRTPSPNRINKKRYENSFPQQREGGNEEESTSKRIGKEFEEDEKMLMQGKMFFLFNYIDISCLSFLLLF
jgi:hypothetical protein